MVMKVNTNVNINDTSARKSTVIMASLIAIVLSTTSTGVLAQSIPATTVFPTLQGIELTSGQQAQVNQIIDNTFFGAKSILNLAQQEQLKALLSQGTPLREAVRSLNLSRSQRRQFQSTAKSARSQLSQVLTPEQQQQWQQNISEQRQQR